ncbi:MAG: glucose/galactose MFS transporter, partial [Bacteroidales bacterium]
LTNLQASRLLSFGGMGLFLVGRLSSVGLMKVMKPSTLLALFGSLSVLCMLVVIFSLGTVSVYALYLSFFLMSIMFPTIFALGVRGLGEHTKKASSYIIMSLIGGAIFPVVMGLIGEQSMALGFILPLFAFVYITGFAWSQRRY